MKQTNSYEWAVVGAGPAGIAAIGKLLDESVKPADIVWIDPAFNVGDFGTKWLKVSSNTRVGLFTKFFETCQSFEYAKAAAQFEINRVAPELTCELSLAAAPLLWISNLLKEKVTSITAKVDKLKLTNRQWEITIGNEIHLAKSVILATGAKPKSLHLPQVEEIPLVTALNPEKLVQTCNAKDTVAVIGASHSAIIIIRTLLEKCSVKKVINFYQSPLRYAVYLQDWILFDDTGLKGETAKWAREHIDGVIPAGLQRVLSNKTSLDLYLPECTKAIHAVGFQKRSIEIEGMSTLDYNDRSGIIAPGLFGFGIGFPEAKTDRFGTVEYRVGLWKFMEYIQNMMPVWMKYNA